MSTKFWKPPEDEIEEWKQLMEGVKRCPSSAKYTKLPVNTSKINVNSEKNDAIEGFKSSKNDLKLGDNAGLDSKRVRAINQGKYLIDAVIDLHGHTASEAYLILEKFIIDSVRNKRRLLLIITGKGKVLNSEIMNWLNSRDINKFILRISHSHKKHGGSGAFYVLLKRRRLQG